MWRGCLMEDGGGGGELEHVSRDREVGEDRMRMRTLMRGWWDVDGLGGLGSRKYGASCDCRCLIGGAMENGELERV